MLDFKPSEVATKDLFRFLLGGVAPRPIALVSTISSDGIRNLSPFSFYNAFGANPPVVIFSPSRRGRDGSLKDTYENLVQTKECVIQAVTYDIIQQVSLSSTEYPPEVDEFTKSGLTPVSSDLVKPDRVAESPFQMECVLNRMLPIGDSPGSANLAICEIIKFHVDEKIIKDGVITPDSIDLVGRNSADYYTRASGNAIFEIEKPVGRTGVGYDALPEYVKASTVLSANNLGQLGNSENIPGSDEVNAFIKSNPEMNNYSASQLEQSAKSALDKNEVETAWFILLYASQLQSRDE